MRVLMVRTLSVSSPGCCFVSSCSITADSELQKKNFRENPGLYLQYRKDIEHELNSRFKFIIKGSKDQREAVKVECLTEWLVYLSY
jgi:hypothetical protein